MGKFKNWLAGVLRDSDWMRGMMNVPPGNSRRLSFGIDPRTFDTTAQGGGAGSAILRLTNKMPGYGVGHELQLFMYHAIREALPIVNNALSARRFLEGDPIIKTKDQGLKRDLERFMREVPVGDHAREAQAVNGMDMALSGLEDNADLYGLGILEPVLTENGQDIERIQLPNPRTFFYEKDSVTGLYRLYQKTKNNPRKEITDPDVTLFTFTYNTEGVWPNPLFWGCPFTVEVMIRMIVSMNNLWWRAGDPAQLWSVLYDPNTVGLSDGEIETDVDELQDIIEGILKNQRAGKHSDGYIGFKGGKIEATTVGANPLSESLAQYFRQHYTTIAGQIIARANVPVWMFPDVELSGEGLNSNRSEQQSAVAMAAAEKRNGRSMKVLRKVLNQWLILNKSAAFIDRYEIDWAFANIRDEKTFEETRVQRETANTAAIENAQRMADLEITEPDDRAGYLQRSGVLPEQID